MKLLRVGEFNQEIVATLDEENKLRDLSSYIKDLNPSTFNEDNLKKLKKLNLNDLPEIKPNRIGSCFNKPTNYFCVGKNFHLHALEVGSKAPKDPMIFSKAISCLSGPNDNIVIPKDSAKVDGSEHKEKKFRGSFVLTRVIERHNKTTARTHSPYIFIVKVYLLP